MAFSTKGWMSMGGMAIRSGRTAGITSTCQVRRPGWRLPLMRR